MTTLNRTILEAALQGLEAQKERIEAQIDQVQAMLVGGLARSVAAPESASRRRRKFSALTRRRMKEAQRRRWATIPGESEPAKAPAKPKRRISREGMKRIIAATKKRWRLQKAAAKASARKAPGKKAAVKKVVAKKTAAKKTAPTPAPDVEQTTAAQ